MDLACSVASTAAARYAMSGYPPSPCTLTTLCVSAGWSEMSSEISAQIITSWTSGSVSGGEKVGGLIGQVSNDFVIIASYSRASVSGAGAADISGRGVGGLIGYVVDTNYKIIASWASGGVASRDGAPATNRGGLVGIGLPPATTVVNSYWNKMTSGQNSAVGNQLSTPLAANGLTTEQMQAIDGTSFGGTDVASRFGGCGVAYSFRATGEDVRYPRLKLYTGTDDGNPPATNTNSDCSNHNTYGPELSGQ